MKLPARFDVGVCSHTGRVRPANEDDYLLASGGAGGPLLVAIADGMGGLAGGAEASRTALRALAVAVLDGRSQAPLAARLRQGFAAASSRVEEAAAAVPTLRDMGTTLTVLCLHDGALGLGHIGDCRAYRRVGQEFEQITVDHTTPAPPQLLTRCLGGGRGGSEPDCSSLPLRPGDRFLLVSDGIHRVVPPAALQAAAAERSPQVAADRLVAAALAAGGPDNATAIVVDVAAGQAGGAERDVDLPRTELDPGLPWPRPVSLRPRIWPWLVLVAAVLLLLRAIGVAAGFDPLAALGDLLWR